MLNVEDIGIFLLVDQDIERAAHPWMRRRTVWHNLQGDSRQSRHLDEMRQLHKHHLITTDGTGQNAFVDYDMQLKRKFQISQPILTKEPRCHIVL